MELKLSTCLLFLSFSIAAAAQTIDYDKRLLSQFSAEQLAKMASSSPATLSYWEYYIDHGFAIVPISDSKDYIFDGTFEATENIDPLTRGIYPVTGRAQYFSDKENGVLLLVYSKELLQSKFEAFEAKTDY